MQSAILAAVIGTTLVGATLWLSGSDTLPFKTGLVAKIAFGMLLALLVMPAILHRVWSVQVAAANICP